MGSEIELRLRPEPVSPILARAAIAVVASGLPAGVVADAELLTSEVVTNAVRHAELEPSQEIVVRIVADGLSESRSATGSTVRSRSSKANLGLRRLGLFMVDAVATSWGVEPVGLGKRVWFEVGASRSGS